MPEQPSTEYKLVDFVGLGKGQVVDLGTTLDAVFNFFTNAQSESRITSFIMTVDHLGIVIVNVRLRGQAQYIPMRVELLRDGKLVGSGWEPPAGSDKGLL